MVVHPATNSDEDLDLMWKEALEEFHKLSGRDPKDFVDLKAKDVIGKINEQKEKDKKHREKYGKATDAVNKTLICIQNLGGIAVQGASMV